MAVYSCKSEAELRACLEEDLQALLRGAIADAVGEVLMAHIESDIYDAYNPERYVRRNVL